MTNTKKIGIWMDHASAHLMPLEAGTTGSTTIHSAMAEAVAGPAEQGDSHIHNAEQRRESAYYKELGEAIKPYNEVLLFGPTNAKAELFNILKGDSHFEKIHIMVEQADKMTENQQRAFVVEHFSGNHKHEPPMESN